MADDPRATVPTLAINRPELELRGSAYRLAVLRGAELAALIPLFADAFRGREFSIDKLQRKYACEYEGVPGFVCVAFTEAGEAAGSVGLLPWPVRCGQLREGAGQMVDVATHSAHRGRGLFVHLAEVVRDLCDAAGLSFLFGFPNEEAYPIWTRKLGYLHVDDLVQYRQRVRTVWVERVAHRIGPMATLNERRLDRALASRAAPDPEFGNSLAAEGFACVERDTAFYAYKGVFAGSRVIRLDGGRVWLRVQHGVLIGDLEAQSEADLERTIAALERLARRLGIHQVIFQASKDTRFASLLEGRFEASPGLPVIHRDIRSRIPAARMRYTFGDLDNF